jgi:hypothetical protein
MCFRGGCLQRRKTSFGVVLRSRGRQIESIYEYVTSFMIFEMQLIPPQQLRLNLENFEINRRLDS